MLVRMSRGGLVKFLHFCDLALFSELSKPVQEGFQRQRLRLSLTSAHECFMYTCMYVCSCAWSLLPHAGSTSLTRD